VRRPVRIDHGTALGDFHVAIAGQCERDAAALRRQLAPAVSTDGTGGI
jgi:hypothetical protein